MKILEKATLKNGVKIQIEDWSEHNTPDYPNLHGLVIGAYPVAKNDFRFVKKNDTFRIDIPKSTYNNYTNADVKADFEALKNGVKSIEDLSNHFHHAKIDMYILGLM